jgi:hypothetical protein
MSRSGYSEDFYFDDPLAWGAWRGRVASATRGKRGQRLLREALAALDAMPEKRLVAHSFQRGDGCVCTLGAVARARGIDVSDLEMEDPEFGDPPENVGERFDIAEPLAKEIMDANDEGSTWIETPEQRWVRMRAWIAERIRP